MAEQKGVHESGVAGIAGFQVPIGLKKRKKKVDEMLELNPSVSVVEAIAYFSGLSEADSLQVESMLDENQYVEIAEMIKRGFAESALRQLIRKRIREVVRKKEGGGGYVLYAPNPHKVKDPKPVGEFPTKLQAKAAELSRFPPKDPNKLKRSRKEVDRLRKDPKKAAEKERQAKKEKPPVKKSKKRVSKPKTKKESFQRSSDMLRDLIHEALFRNEERTGSQWNEYVKKLSKQAVIADKKFQNLAKGIAKRSDKSMREAFKSVQGALESAGFAVDGGDVSKDEGRGQVYLEFAVNDEEGTTGVRPFYIFIDNGRPKIEVSDDAKNSLTKMDPQRSKQLRAELLTVQEQVLDQDSQVADAITKRDEYLSRMQDGLDKTVSGLSSLEITMLKKLLVDKYRKVT